MIATRENFRPLIELENVRSNDLDAKRFSSTTWPSPALHLPSARVCTSLPEPRC